jgi:RND family efflux transporter MFP subunit
LDNLDARLKGLKAQLEEARLSLNRTKIKAPINGRINEVMAKKGDWVGVAKPIAQILQYEKVKVSVGVPESDVASVFDLDEAQVTIDALGGLKVVGKKYFLARQPRSLARLYDLELLIDNPDGRILPGMFARVELVKQVFENALMIPLYSVISQGKENFVYIINDSKAHKRHVALGVLDQWEIQIKDGLKPGDQVVVVGHRMLDEGQLVEIIKNVEDTREILQS